MRLVKLFSNVRVSRGDPKSEEKRFLCIGKFPREEYEPIGIDMGICIDMGIFIDMGIILKS